MDCLQEFGAFQVGEVGVGSCSACGEGFLAGIWVISGGRVWGGRVAVHAVREGMGCLQEFEACKVSRVLLDGVPGAGGGGGKQQHTAESRGTTACCWHACQHHAIIAHPCRLPRVSTCALPLASALLQACLQKHPEHVAKIMESDDGSGSGAAVAGDHGGQEAAAPASAPSDAAAAAAAAVAGSAGAQQQQAAAVHGH